MSLGYSPFLPPSPATSRQRFIADYPSPRSLQLSPHYHDFSHELQRALPSLDRSTPTNSDDKDIRAALEVLRTRRRVIEEGEEDEEGGEDKEGEKDEKKTKGENVNMVDKESQQPLAIRDALKILVQNATREFGFAPRDVYRGVFTLPDARNSLNAVVRSLTYEQLKDIVGAFERDGSLTDQPSHQVFEVYPCPPPAHDDSWTIKFKSASIAKKVAVALQKEEDKYLRQMYPSTA